MSQNVLLIRNVRPEYYGGGETYQLVLADELKKHGFHPIIVTSSKKLLEESRKNKIECVEAPYNERQNFSGLRNLFLPVYIFNQKKLRRWYDCLFEKYSPEAVNIQSRDDWIAGTLVAKKKGIKILWTDHMDLRSWVFQNINVPYKNFIGKMIVRASKYADKIIMISDYEERQVKKMLLPKKMNNMVVIKNGAIDRREEVKNIKVDKNSFIYIGRLVSYKGVFELIEAFKLVAKKYPKARLNIYGDGGDAEKCKEMAEGCKQIVFHGYTDDPLAAIAENYCFVLPSYREGLSLSLLDAAMMGKIMIASKVDGNPEVVKNGQTGLLVPAMNVDKLAKSMMAVLEDRAKAEEMARGARKLYEENFNFKKTFVEKMLPLYNRKDKEEKK